MCHSHNLYAYICVLCSQSPGYLDASASPQDRIPVCFSMQWSYYMMWQGISLHAW